MSNKIKKNIAVPSNNIISISWYEATINWKTRFSAKYCGSSEVHFPPLPHMTKYNSSSSFLNKKLKIYLSVGIFYSKDANINFFYK